MLKKLPHFVKQSLCNQPCKVTRTSISIRRLYRWNNTNGTAAYEERGNYNFVQMVENCIKCNQCMCPHAVIRHSVTEAEKEQAQRHMYIKAIGKGR